MMLGSGMNLVTTIIGFGLCATFIVFVCSRLICGRLRRMESRQRFEVDSRMDFEMPEYRISGLAPDVVAAIPTIKFYDECFGNIEDAQCVICLGEYQEKEVLRVMPKCGHSFHLPCIDVWLRRQSTCPVCRLPVKDSSQNEPEQPAIHGSGAQSFDSTGISTEHSQSWLLPSAEQAVGHRSDQVPANSVAIEVDSSSAGIAPVRS